MVNCHSKPVSPLFLQSLSLVLFLISIVIAAVALGLDQWSQQEVDRGRGRTTDSSTKKFQGLVKRCVQYEVSDEVNSCCPLFTKSSFNLDKQFF